MKRQTSYLQLTLMMGAALLLVIGCSSSSKQVNIQDGEYYSEDEYEELSKGDKESYCSNLSRELNGLNSHIEERNEVLKATEDKIQNLRKELGPVERELLRTNSDIRTLESQIEALEELPETWIIQPGECLWNIAGYDDIYADPVKWPRLWRGNMDIIEDPEWIWPDTVLVVPRTWPKMHTVQPDEYLSLIAGYWEVYGNPLEWTKLFEANKDRISYPELIQPDQVLTIPR